MVLCRDVPCVGHVCLASLAGGLAGVVCAGGRGSLCWGSPGGMARAEMVQARGSQGSPRRGRPAATAEVGASQGIPGSGRGAEAGVSLGLPGCSALGVPWQVVWSCSGTGPEYCKVLCTCVTLARWPECCPALSGVCCPGISLVGLLALLGAWGLPWQQAQLGCLDLASVCAIKGQGIRKT